MDNFITQLKTECNKELNIVLEEIKINFNNKLDDLSNNNSLSYKENFNLINTILSDLNQQNKILSDSLFNFLILYFENIILEETFKHIITSRSTNREINMFNLINYIVQNELSK